MKSLATKVYRSQNDKLFMDYLHCFCCIVLRIQRLNKEMTADASSLLTTIFLIRAGLTLPGIRQLEGSYKANNINTCNCLTFMVVLTSPSIFYWLCYLILTRGLHDDQGGGLLFHGFHVLWIYQLLPRSRKWWLWAELCPPTSPELVTRLPSMIKGALPCTYLKILIWDCPDYLDGSGPG